jgi:serine/threonine-protein kinase ULK/ATG1
MINEIRQLALYQPRKKIEQYSYSPCEQIGKGYSSQVFRARNDLTLEPLAVKVVDLRGLEGIPRALLDEEVAILRQLSHPHVLQCRDVLVTPNHCYLITELCQGDLAALLKARPMPESQALAYLADIISGLLYLAGLSILHRDLKPANIFLRDGRCKIADFGFAKKGSPPGIRERYNVGSPLYMSPESLKNNVYSTKNDIWSLGIICYEMLYGRTPWPCRSEH